MHGKFCGITCLDFEKWLWWMYAAFHYASDFFWSPTWAVTFIVKAVDKSYDCILVFFCGHPTLILADLAIHCQNKITNKFIADKHLLLCSIFQLVIVNLHIENELVDMFHFTFRAFDCCTFAILGVSCCSHQVLSCWIVGISCTEKVCSVVYMHMVISYGH